MTNMGIGQDDWEEFAAMTDESVVELARDGDDAALEYLIHKYKNFVRAKARSYFLIGADREDIIQEGMIGLYKAIRDFRCDKLSSFRAFAELCITRQIITAIKTATRQKHIPLNSYVSLNKPIYDEDSDRTLMDVISGSKITDPEELISHLANIRILGYGICDEEFEVGVTAIAAPIRDWRGEVQASLAVIGPTLRLSGDFKEKVIQTVKEKAKEVSNQLGDIQGV